MFAAARRPEVTPSLALLEPPAFSLAGHKRAQESCLIANSVNTEVITDMRG